MTKEEVKMEKVKFSVYSGAVYIAKKSVIDRYLEKEKKHPDAAKLFRLGVRLVTVNSEVKVTVDSNWIKVDSNRSELNCTGRLKADESVWVGDICYLLDDTWGDFVEGELLSDSSDVIQIPTGGDGEFDGTIECL